MNERKLYDTPTDMEEEVTKAKAMAELMRMCYKMTTDITLQGQASMIWNTPYGLFGICS